MFGVSQAPVLITTELTNRDKPVEEVVNVVNHAFDRLLEAHNLDPREYLLLQELGSRSDQPSCVVVV